MGKDSRVGAGGGWTVSSWQKDVKVKWRFKDLSMWMNVRWTVFLGEAWAGGG